MRLNKTSGRLRERGHDPDDAHRLCFLFAPRSGRSQYLGFPMALAKAVADCGNGGMILMTQSTFKQLAGARAGAEGTAAGPHATPHSRAKATLMNLGELALKDTSLPAVCLYQVRAAHLGPHVLNRFDVSSIA